MFDPVVTFKEPLASKLRLPLAAFNDTSPVVAVKLTGVAVE